MTPSPLAEHVFKTLVRDHEWREAILGDLREEFADVARRDGARTARRWHWRQVLAISGRRLVARLGGDRGRTRNWIAPPDSDLASGWRTGLVRDMRYAVRSLARRPATSIVIVLTLAVTLAVNTTMFALLDAMVLRPYRFPDVDRMVMVMSTSPNDPLTYRESVATADFRDCQREASTLTHLSAAEWWDANLSGIETPQQVPGYRVTADFFEAVGVQPVLGRDFRAEDETPGNHRRAVLGYRLWQRQFGGDAGIVGRVIRLDGEPYEVVGVAPPRFAIPDGAEIWAPIAYTAEQWNNRRRGYLNVIGRLADGVSIEQARAQVSAIVERQRRDYPETNAARPIMVTDFTTGMADPGAGPFVLTVQAAALLLMLIACANIANLLLARGSERTQEYAMRLALGATRGRLAWQTVLEGTSLTAIAIVLAMPLAWALIGLTRASIPTAIIRFIPGWDYIHLSPLLFVATALAGGIATLLFALVPALHAAGAGVSEGLRHGGRAFTASRQRHWLRSALATSQVALTLALLFGSLLAIGAANRAVDGALGFDKRNLLIGRVILPERPYAEAERRRRFIETVLDRMRAVPAVTSVAMVNNLPYAGGNTARGFWPEGVVLESRDVRSADLRKTTPDYFSTLGIPILRGRVFNSGDRLETRPVAVVSQSVTERYWPNEDPIGRRFKLAADGEWITIVGVSGDVLHDWFQQRRAPTVYLPLAQDAPFAAAFVMRTIGDPESVAGDLTRAVAAADPDQPLLDLKTMEALMTDRTAGITFIARALGVVSLIAFALAITGLYSLMAFMAARRTQEIGVRMALGANWWSVIRLATAQAVRITLLGSIVGGAMAIGVGQVMESVLKAGVSNSLWYLPGLIALLWMVALTAAYFPARRAAAINPTTALRAE